MSQAAVLPDVEQLAIAWLDAQADVPGHVGTKAPSPVTYPYLTVERVGGTPVTARFVDEASLQISVWGGTRAEASTAARTALAAMVRMTNYRTAGGIASFNRVELGPSWLPDTARTPPTARFVFSVAVVAHPPN